MTDNLKEKQRINVTIDTAMKAGNVEKIKNSLIQTKKAT